MTITKLVRLSKKGQLVLPKDMRSELGIKDGDELMIIKNDTCILITTPEHFARSTRGILKHTWGESRVEMDATICKERDAWG